MDEDSLVGDTLKVSESLAEILVSCPLWVSAWTGLT